MSLFRAFSFAFVCWAWATVAAADISAAPATLDDVDPFGTFDASAVPGCPDQGGILNSVSVPVGDPLDLAVVLTSGVAPEGGARFRLSSDDASVVAVGDRRQGFLPEVFIPEGESVSNPFTVFGIEVGGTILRAISLTQGISGFAVPAGAWDVGDDDEDKFLDPNRPGTHCRVAGDSPELSTNESMLAGCGVTAKGAVTDGVTRLLMRMQSGLPGTGCFEIVSGGENEGEIETALGTTMDIGTLHQVSSYYLTPDSFLDSAPSRSVEVEFTFTPSIGNGNTTRFTAEFELIRPPVVLIHGLWSNPGAWGDFWIRNDEFHTTVNGNYAATHGASFAINVPQVRGFLLEAIQRSRSQNSDGYATTQADVIGHSMGGNLARLFIQDAANERPGNLGEGDIRRLVTLATPHLGSSFANLIVALHNVAPGNTREVIAEVIPADNADPRNGAICDLAENSSALQALADGTTIPAHVVTATGGPPGTPGDPAKFWGGVTILHIGSFEAALTDTVCVRRELIGRAFVCVEERALLPQDLVDGHRFRQLNDAIVPLSSANAGFPQGSSATINYPDLLHFGGGEILWWTLVDGPTNTEAVAEHVFGVLDQSTEQSAWASSFPAFSVDPPANGSGVPWTVPGIPGGDGPDAAAFQAQCGPGGPMTFAALGKSAAAGAKSDSRVQITTPDEGQVFAPGDTVQVVLEIDPSLEITDAEVSLLPGGGDLEIETSDLVIWKGEFFLPQPVSGPIHLAPSVRTVGGEYIDGPERTIFIIPEVAPEEIYLLQRPHRVDLATGETAQLFLRAKYAGGIERSITLGILGTNYTSDDPDVAVVDEDGLITPVGLGSAAITVEHRGLIEYALVKVREGQEPLLPVAVTDRFRITRGGLRLNRNTGFFVQQVRFVNAGNTPVIAPLYALVRDLTAGVTSINTTRETNRVAPLGTPYFPVPLGPDGLSFPPGTSVDLVFEFLNPDRSGIEYWIEIIHTDLDP